MYVFYSKKLNLIKNNLDSLFILQIIDFDPSNMWVILISYCFALKVCTMYLLQDYDKNYLLLKSGINKKTINKTEKRKKRSPE